MSARWNLFLLILLLAGQLPAERIPLETEKALSSWKKTVQGISLENGFVKIEPTAEDTARGRGVWGIWKSFQFDKLAGRDVILSVEMSLHNLSPLPERKHCGSKFQISFRQGGRSVYRGVPGRLGSAAW